MTESIEQIELRLLAEYEAGHNVDIAEWVVRFPDYRDGLLDFWLWVRRTPRISDAADEYEVGADEVTHDVLRDACLAMSLCDDTLLSLSAPDSEEERRLGRGMAAVRARPHKVEGKARGSFRRAAVYAWITQCLSLRRRRVTRLAVQKSAYLLEVGLHCELFTEHKQNALGPYDSKAKYSDAEPIAAKRDWMRIEGTLLTPGPAIAEAAKYAPRYVRSAELAKRLIDYLATLTDEELEVWATVTWIGREATAHGSPLTAVDVRKALAAIPAWSAKLAKEHFSLAHIERALSRLVSLRLLDV